MTGPSVWLLVVRGSVVQNYLSAQEARAAGELYLRGRPGSWHWFSFAGNPNPWQLRFIEPGFPDHPVDIFVREYFP